MSNVTRQRGISFLGVLVCLAASAVLVVGALRCLPPWVEHFAVRRSVESLRADAGVTRQELRAAFDRQAEVEGITGLSGSDLHITRVNEGFELSYSYERRVHLFGNVSVVFDFEGSVTRPVTDAQE